MLLKNVKVKWAAVIKPNTKFEHKWQIDAVLTPEQAKTLKDKGLTVKMDKDGDTIIQCKRKVNKRDGSPNDPPTVVDGLKQPFTKAIGNGSVCNIRFSPFEYEKGKFTNYLQGVQVVDHVPYGDDDDDFEVIEDTSGGAAGSGDFDDDIPF